MQIYYMFRSETQIGPLNADEFMQHISNGRLKNDTPVFSPQLTGGKWTTFAALDLPAIERAAAPLRQERPRRQQLKSALVSRRVQSQ